MTRRYFITLVTVILTIVLVVVLYPWNIQRTSKYLPNKMGNQFGPIELLPRFQPVFFDMPPTPPSLPGDDVYFPCYNRVRFVKMALVSAK